MLPTIVSIDLPTKTMHLSDGSAVQVRGPDLFMTLTAPLTGIDLLQVGDTVKVKMASDGVTAAVVLADRA